MSANYTQPHLSRCQRFPCFILLTVFLFSCYEVLAQQQLTKNTFGTLPKVIPSSPEAGALGKYAEWPVSMYTGVPNINIPLYGIKIQGVDLPIGLSYHSGGVKVDDVSSWAGVGWSLTAGGAITRTVVGLPNYPATYSRRQEIDCSTIFFRASRYGIPFIFFCR